MKSSRKRLDEEVVFAVVVVGRSCGCVGGGSCDVVFGSLINADVVMG